MTGWVIGFLIISWAVFLVAIWKCCVLFLKHKEKSLSTKILIVSAILFFSIFFMRMATCVYLDYAVLNKLLSPAVIDSLGEYAVEMPWTAHVIRSITQALRTFAIDEDVRVVYTAAKSMGENEFIKCGFVRGAYMVHACLVTVLAPVASGAIIFDILTRFFPRLRLKTKGAGCEFYVFSELNDSSLALAESILENFDKKKDADNKEEDKGRILDPDLRLPVQKKKEEQADSSEKKKKKEKKVKAKRPVIVFTDAYMDNEDEGVSERIAMAKSMGAICLTDDIFHININRAGRKITKKCNYILIDEKEDNNLHTLSLLSEYEKGVKLRGACVYLFSGNTSANQLVNCVNKKLAEDNVIPEEERPVIRVIDGYKNLVYNLLTDVPLYEPLVGCQSETDKTPRDLNVTIIGSGSIGMQMFLATYWMGQILDVKLHINVVSQETETSFKDRINLINEDILKTEASVADDEILRIYSRTKEKADPYFTMRYFETDVMTGDLYEAISKPVGDDGFSLCNSDYFVVAIGSDEKNILVADKLRCYIGRTLLGSNKKKRAVINYVVYDKAVCSSLNTDRGDSVVYMNAFGNFSDVYNYDNVFMSKTYGTAMELDESYNKKSENLSLYGKKQMEAFLKDEYRYWSTMARGLHIPYKYFSAGVVTKSWCFDNACCVTEDSQVFNAYLRKVCVELESTKENSLPDVKEREALYYRLCWLEHRRWNAFIRTGGFTAPSKEQLDEYAYMNGNGAKELSLKFHPCLVECDEFAPSILTSSPRSAEISENQRMDTDSISEKNYDRLDAVSMYLHILAKDRENSGCCVYKAYDSPYEIYNGVLTIQ